MKRLTLLLLVMLSSLCAIRVARASDAFDERITLELRQLNAAAVPIFEQANRARESEDHARAAELYARVFEMAPKFDHALRRQAYEELLAGRRERGIELGRKALGMARTPENLSALAAILAPPEGKPESDAKEAAKLATEAFEAAPSDVSITQAFCEVGFKLEDSAMTTRGVARLFKLAPGDPRTHYIASIAAATDGKMDEARASLENARRLGLPEKEYDTLRTAYDSARPLWQIILIFLAKVTAAWLGGLGILFVAGWFLSRAATRAATPSAVGIGGRTAGLSTTVRNLYRIVIGVACAYYYVSIPIVIAFVLLLGGGLLYAIFAIGHIPVKLVIMIAAITLISVWSILKSLFVRVKEEDPGLQLRLADHPRLKKVLEEVAMKIGTRPVDNVYLTPGTDVAVYERGSLLREIRGTRERCLILGAGVLPGFRIRAFKAVLGHEYGHFSNRDTAGGRFALAVRNSLLKTGYNLARGGAAAWYNPAWLFVNGFYRIFLRISQGASRLQEALADRWAAIAYGAASFEEGLRHVIGESVRFDAHVGATLKEVVEEKRALANLYEFDPKGGTDPESIEKAIRESLEREPSAYDSHPAPAERFRWVSAIGAKGVAPSVDDEQEVWTLFNNRPALERAMTAEVRKNVAANYGVHIETEETAGVSAAPQA